MKFSSERLVRSPRRPRANCWRSPKPSRPFKTVAFNVEKINAPFLYQLKGSPAEYGAGMKRAIENGWLKMHESGTFVRFTQAGADLFA